MAIHAGSPGGVAQRVLRAATDPITRAAATLVDPGTYAAPIREAAATVATMRLWPRGFGPAAFVDDRRTGSTADDVPVLLVHGLGANRSNWHFVERRLRSAGFGSLHGVNYNPLTSDLPGLAQWCAGEVAALRDRLGVDQVHVVGHSLGGILARYAVQVLGVEGVATCVTLASPHGGVALARHVRPLPGGLGTVTRQLDPGSPEMVLLRSSARPLATRFVAYGAGADVIVPAQRALIREPELGATNLLVPYHGHLSLLFSGALADSLVHQLGEVASPATDATLPAAA